MREKKQIEKLTKDAETIQFPWSNYTFHNWKQALIHVLAENDLNTEEGWEYDEYDRTFGSTFRVFRHLEGTGISVTFKLAVTLNPKKPLLDEIARLLHEKATFEAKCNQLIRAMTAGEGSR